MSLVALMAGTDIYQVIDINLAMTPEFFAVVDGPARGNRHLNGSENCSRTHPLVIDTFQDAGLPPGKVNRISNAPVDPGAVVEAMWPTWPFAA